MSLARPASGITLLQVVEALEGPVRLNRCLIEPDACPRSTRCPVHEVLALAQRELVELLGVTTFESLVLASARRAAPAARHQRLPIAQAAESPALPLE